MGTAELVWSDTRSLLCLNYSGMTSCIRSHSLRCVNSALHWRKQNVCHGGCQHVAHAHTAWACVKGCTCRLMSAIILSILSHPSC